MIEISPAILTDNKKEFVRQLKAYTAFAKQVDIDINIPDDNFPGHATVELGFVLDQLLHEQGKFGTHLMVAEPLALVNVFIRTPLPHELVFYIHQEANYKSIIDVELPPKYALGVAVKAESELMDLEFYQQFAEVQLMTIKTGEQGNPFLEAALRRAAKLRALGFTGKISCDGGVDLETAKLIKNEPIDRVSVGSYLSTAVDPEAAYRQLDAILNA